MSQFEASVIAQLRCPDCHAENDPKQTVCEWDAKTNEVYCTNCSHSGDIAKFLRRDRPAVSDE